MANLFYLAGEIIRNKGMVNLTRDERHTVGAAMILINHPACPYPADMTVQDILDDLASQFEGAGLGCRR